MMYEFVMWLKFEVIKCNFVPNLTIGEEENQAEDDQGYPLNWQEK